MKKTKKREFSGHTQLPTFLETYLDKIATKNFFFHGGSFINRVDMTGKGVGVFQMTILLHKPYFVKLSTKG